MHPTTHYIRYCALTGILILSSAILVAAQSASSPGQPSTADSLSGGAIRGRVVLPSGGFLSEGVRITLQTIRGVESSVYTDNSGRFEFTRLSAGRYQVLVEPDPQRFESASESLEVVRGMLAVVNITLREKALVGRPKAAAISATELDENVPSKARKEFELATSDSKDGKAPEAVDHFRKAVALYPRYLMAHNDLGAELIGLGQLDEAENELNVAISIDHSAFNPVLNLGIVMVKKHEFERAKELLDKAISLQAQSPAARLFRGLAFLGISDASDAEKDFIAAYEMGGSQYAEALFHLGQLYLDKGDRNSAREYFQRYLRDVPNASNSVQVRKLIAMLE